MVNTCGFVEAAKKDSVDTLLEARRPQGARAAPQAVVAVGCLAERYGKDLAESLPEADAVLGFDDYPDIAARLRSILAGEAHQPHTPQDRRRLLPISPVDRDAVDAVACPATARRRLAADELGVGAPGHRPPRRTPPARRRPDGAAEAGQRLRPPLLVLRDPELPRLVREPPALRRARRGAAGWPTQGVRELFLVSENSTSYGKDLGDLRLLETLLPELAAVDGVERVRVSYLQPAETRPGLVEAIATTPGRGAVLRPVLPARQRRRCCAGCAASATPRASSALLDRVRALAPAAGVRSNVIVGFPGETEDDLQTLCDFLVAARLDVTGVFGYSDEDGTEAAALRRQARRRRDPGPGRARDRPGRGAHRAAGRGADRRGRRRAGRVVDWRPTVRAPRAAPTTRVPRSTAPPALDGAGAARRRRPRRRRRRRQRGRRPGREPVRIDARRRR